MNKIFRIKSDAGLVAVALSEIQGVRVSFTDGDATKSQAEIVLRGQSVMDAQMSSEEIDALLHAWNSAL